MGVLPGGNAVYGDGDDTGTGTASGILSFSSRGDVDTATRLEAGTFGRVKIRGVMVDVPADPRCLLLA